MDNAELNTMYSSKVVPGKEQTKTIKEKLMPDFEKVFDCIHRKDPRFVERIGVGSAYQGLKTCRSDEFDFTLCLNYNQRGVGPGGPSRVRYYGFKDHDSTDNEMRSHIEPVILSDGRTTNLHITLDEQHEIGMTRRRLPPPPPGYSAVPLNEKELQLDKEAEKPFSFDGDLIPFLVKMRLKALLIEAVKLRTIKGSFSLSPTAHGPALTLRYEHPSDDIKFNVSIDLSPAIRWGSFKACGFQWPPPNSRWPSTDLIKAIKEKGLLLVAKRNFYWRISFAECEKELCVHCDNDGGCRKKVHRIMKFWHKKYWYTQSNPEISSYVVKNVWMHEMEKYPNPDDWKQDRLSTRLFGCIDSLVNYVKKRNLQSYFNRDDNLLKDKDATKLKQEVDKIIHFRYNIREYI